MPRCLNPDCGKEFDPGHYGDRQKVCGADACTKWYKQYWSETNQPARGIPDRVFLRIVEYTWDEVMKNSMIVVARHTGLRKGELLGLLWSDVVDHDNTIVISAPITRQWSDKKGGFKQTKTGGARTAYFPDEAQAALERLYLHAQPGRSDRIFMISAAGIYKWFIRKQEELDIVNPNTGYPYRFHDLRHALGVELVRSGRVDLAKKMLGHKNIQTTMRYADQTDEELLGDIESLRSKDE